MERITIKRALDICKEILEGKSKENIVIFADTYYTERYLIERIKEMPGVYDMVGYTEASKDATGVMCNPFMGIDAAMARAEELNLPLIYVAGISYNLNNPKGSEPNGLTCYQCYNPDALTASQLVELLSQRKDSGATVTIDGNILGYISGVQNLESSDITLHIEGLDSWIPEIKE